MSLFYSLRVFWYRTDKAAWVFALLVIVMLTAFAFLLQAVFADQDDRRNRVREFHQKDIACLARNIYFEARGEPTAGQFAVAEVTMNRKAAKQYPRTVCDVVYQKGWDPIRGRYVGAFSWTEFSSLPEPDGDEWARARKIAEAVYYQRYAPQLQGALHYHATYIKPDWAKNKRPITRIGKHVFYK